MEPTSRDSYENADTGEHNGWVSIRTTRRDDNGGLKRREDAIAWGNAEFGDDFFYLGGKFFFASEQQMIQFKLIWA